jgi:hypothetical protein
MIGGISHMEAAKHIQVNNATIRNFSLSEISKMIDWQPELLTCYPSVLRELLGKYQSELGFLKGIKAGGEKLLPADCKKVFSLIPNALIIEQYGSTELPALALRSFTKSNFHSEGDKILTPFELQSERFSFMGKFSNGWNPVVARDDFSNLVFDMKAFYDTGDEAFSIGSSIVDFRRRCDKEHDYWKALNSLFEANIVNCQIDLRNKTIFYEGSEHLNNHFFEINSMIFTFQQGILNRILRSNKLPLLIQ